MKKQEPIAIILAQLMACLNNRAHGDDMEALSFSLQHLFRNVDFLYRKALPDLVACTAPAVAGREGRPRNGETLLSHQLIWTQLQTISRTLNRLEAICYLLSDAIESVLGTLDMRSSYQAKDWQDGLHSPHAPMQTLAQEQWDAACNALLWHIRNWQQSYPTGVAGPQLNAAFATLVHGAKSIFADILPAAGTISAGNDEATATLLFDLIQHSDQLLVQMDTALELLDALVEDLTLRG